MALETSPESPAPLRTIALSLEKWIDRLGAVWVEAQVTQLNRRPGLQTVFLTLRDPLADVSLSATVHRDILDRLTMPLAEGAKVVVLGKPSYYTTRGSLSLQIREIRPIGIGALLEQIERRRQLLEAEGLFAAELKRRLPFLPHTVGLVTAPDSAAEKDVLENARRRWHDVTFRVLHATMQGPRSAAEVISALQRLDADPAVDVIVIARGGGSVEDLLPFSDEGLLRAVHAARTPVVSAIGHEPDSPLLDLVADVRASTPTDAAKRVVPDVEGERLHVSEARHRLRAAVDRLLAREQVLLDSIRSRPALADPRSLLDDRAAEIIALRDRARRTVGHRLDRAADEIGHQRARARALSPLETLRRGYAVVQDAGGHVLVSVAEISAGSELTIRVADGRIRATTTSTEETEAADGEE